jgi:hypothetical protein
MFRWIDMVGLTQPVAYLRGHEAVADVVLPATLLYNLPAACWSYSFCLAIGLIWRNADRVQCWASAATAVAIAVGGEVIQLSPLVPGVFDPTDCVADGIAAIVACAVAQRLRWEV